MLKPALAEAKIGPEDIEGALKERLEIYRRTKVVAETEGNISKARRYGRICKQFEDAIKLHTRGKPVPLDELPVPPGFPPLSHNSQDNSIVAPSPSPKPKPVAPESNSATSPAQPKPIPPPRTGKKIIKSRTYKLFYKVYAIIYINNLYRNPYKFCNYSIYIYGSLMLYFFRTETKSTSYIACREANDSIAITAV